VREVEKRWHEAVHVPMFGYPSTVPRFLRSGSNGQVPGEVRVATPSENAHEKGEASETTGEHESEVPPQNMRHRLTNNSNLQHHDVLQGGSGNDSASTTRKQKEGSKERPHSFPPGFSHVPQKHARPVAARKKNMSHVPDHHFSTIESQIWSPFGSQGKADRLVHTLLANYRKEIPPVASDGEPTRVGIGVNFVKLHHLDESAGTISVWLNLRLCWADERLNFDAATFFNTSWHHSDKFPLESGLVWTPDIAVLNQVGAGSGVGLGYAVRDSVILTDQKFLLDTGVNVLWSRRMEITTSCHVNLSWYPFDVQKCAMLFGSWASSNNILQIVPQPFFADKSISTGEFLVRNITSALHETYVAEYANQVTQMEYSFVLERYPHYFIVNFVLPMMGVTVLALVTMWMGHGNTAGRVNAATKMLLCVVSTMFITAGTPASASTDIWLDRFQSHCLALSMSCVLQSLFVDYIAQSCKLPSWSPTASDLDCIMRSIITTSAGMCFYSDFSELREHDLQTTLFNSSDQSVGMLLALIYFIFWGAAMSAAWSLVSILWRWTSCFHKKEEGDQNKLTVP